MGLFDKEEAVKDEAFEQEVSYTPVPEEVKDEVPEVAVISSTTRIEGNITTDGSIVVNGDVQGNVTTKGNLVLSGNTTGEIFCNSILIDTKESNSDIIAEENIIVAEETTINGNVNCKNITISGAICGDVTATGCVIVKSTAVVKGNISAKQIGVECGAVVNGKVTINK